MALVLIVDDVPEIRTVVRQAVESCGHAAIEAGDGAAAVRAFRDRRPDIVIMDLVMPREDGIAAIRRIRQIDPAARIIAISGSNLLADYAVPAAARQLGADRALAKPFRIQELLRAITDLAERE